MSTSGKKESGGASGFEACPVPACKAKVHQFGFCSEHFDHFKFGLVKKNGQPAADYEKKLSQYQDFKEHKVRPAKKAA
jgi:hypothetical protein